MELEVKNFSCLRDVNVRFKDVTILIGEQGSGKSVLYKLTYYLVDKISKLSLAVLLNSSISNLSSIFIRDFEEWFPRQTWGGMDFEINFKIGNAAVKLLRNKEDIKVSFNTHLEEGLKSLEQDFKYYQALLDKDGGVEKKGGYIERLVDFLVHELKNDLNKKTVGEGISTRQVYVPAGRALFTSLSKTVSVLTESEDLDEITKEFAKVYMTSLDSLRKNGVDAVNSPLFQDIFKGEFSSEGNSDFIEMEDGRRVPLNILSSGQQEAFPLLALLCSRASRAGLGRESGGMMYVEELEAHLFPKAQGDLLELLVAARKKTLGFDKLFISTHSPYVLSKLNNLLLAGQIHEKTPQVHSRLSEIIDNHVWLSNKSVSAYALNDGRSVSIIDEDVGLIDGEYLDSFSACLEEELSELMELEINAY